MAHLSDCGIHCADPYCKQKDLLPVSCDACGQIYCSEHFKYDAHNCAKGRKEQDRRVIVCPICTEAVPLAHGEDANVVWETHAASGKCHPPPPPKPRCPVNGCKEKLTAINSFCCGTCCQKVCMKHRFEDSHECRPQRARVSAWHQHGSKQSNLLAQANKAGSSFADQMRGLATEARRLVK